MTPRQFFTRPTRREAAGLNPSEHTEAVRFMRAVRLHEKAHPVLEWLHAIPNGGWRKKSVAKKLKAEGVRPGVHDYFLPVQRQGFAGLYIELKSEGGKPDPEQVKFAAFVRAQGYRAEFCKGYESAWAVVCDYLGIRNALA